MKTLAGLVSDMEELGEREAVVYHDGLRTRKWSYRELLRAVAGVAEEMKSLGLTPSDRVLLWGENRPEWVAVFWASVSGRIALVPVDFRSSKDFVSRVQKDVGAKLLIHGASVEAEGLDLPRIDFEAVSRMRSESRLALDAVGPEDVVQVIYTSGTTGEPKGVVHRHRHLAPNLGPIRREIRKYGALARPFQPIRFLDLLPLSHVFGQFAGLYVPPLMGGSVVFLKEVHPGAILETIRRERVSVLISVPRLLESLRREIERRFDLARPRVESRGLWGGLRRFFRYRDVHAAFGFKFWAILSGGARLPPNEEDFWFRLGFVLVQGYGLTETSSLVTTNHPLHPTRGSVGKIVGSQEVKLAPDGEILVRGSNVSLELFGRAAPPDADADVWLHTGDLGEIGPDGTLFYRGRKKDVIVGPEGLNVYPADVETALARDPGVKESVVLGRPTDRGEVVHAVLLLRDAAADPRGIIERANRELEHHQRIREWTVWPDEDFPRTASTFKVRRHEVAKAIERRKRAKEGAGPPEGVSAVRALVAERLGRPLEDVRPSQQLSAELGLSSIDRIELLSSLEERYGVELPETEMASVVTVDELERWVHREAEVPRAPAEEREASPFSGVVRFARLLPVRLLRFAFLETVVLPLLRHYVPLTVEGTLEGVKGPVIFAPNHTSHLDTLAVLAALPPRFRHRLAPAMSQESFVPYFDGTGGMRERASLALRFWLAVITLNVFPLPQATRGVRKALQFAGKLADSGYSILIFPEGARTPDGTMREFRPGVGVMAVRLGIPVVPIHIQGLYEVFPVDATWPRPGPARLRFGSPIAIHETEDFREAAKRVEEEVRRLGREWKKGDVEMGG
jgi:long-chain acyl-CoA synthetase